ncbi:regulatory protein BlaR1 [Peptococcaceae bacterium CEB3]|nr:regulatory protein BlaR1 [Peptococcaceae bacterium CEB3]
MGVGRKNGDLLSLIFALFHWVLLSSLIACLIIPMILLLKWAVKDKLSYSWHYFIWFILLVRLVLPVAPGCRLSIFNIVPDFNYPKHLIYNLQIPYERGITNQTEAATGPSAPPAKIQSYTPPNVSHILHTYPSPTVAGPGGEPNWGQDVGFLALLIWLTGTVGFGIRILWLYWRWSRKIRSTAREAGKSERLIFDQCRSILNIRTDIAVIVTAEVRTPGLFGFFRPVLLLPHDLSTQISSSELRQIFLHELTHYQRKDFIVNGLVVALKVIHWFNPLLWYGFNLMRQDCEIACDARVLSRMNPEEHLNYGYMLIHLARIAKSRRSPGIIGITAKGSMIKRRILMISSFRKKSTRSIAIGTVSLILLAAIMLTGATNSAAAKVTRNKVRNSGQAFSDRYAGQNASHRGQVKKANTGTTSPLSLLDIQGQNFVGKFTGKMMVVLDPSKVEVGFSSRNSRPDKTTSQLAKEYKAVGAINGGASVTDSVFGPAVSTAGFVMSHAKILFNSMKEGAGAQDVAALTDEGKLVVGKHTVGELKKMGVKEGVTAGLPLIINGVSQDLSRYAGINSQTAIGQEANGTVLLLAINGRSKESMGATLNDVQNIFLKHGAVNAALLDGGSLSTMYYQGAIVNRPPDGEQIVSSAFLVMP